MNNTYSGSSFSSCFHTWYCLVLLLKLQPCLWSRGSPTVMFTLDICQLRPVFCSVVFCTEMHHLLICSSMHVHLFQVPTLWCHTNHQLHIQKQRNGSFHHMQEQPSWSSAGSYELLVVGVLFSLHKSHIGSMNQLHPWFAIIERYLELTCNAGWQLRCHLKRGNSVLQGSARASSQAASTSFLLLANSQSVQRLVCKLYLYISLLSLDSV